MKKDDRNILSFIIFITIIGGIYYFYGDKLTLGATPLPTGEFDDYITEFDLAEPSCALLNGEECKSGGTYEDDYWTISSGSRLSSDGSLTIGSRGSTSSLVTYRGNLKNKEIKFLLKGWVAEYRGNPSPIYPSINIRLGGNEVYAGSVTSTLLVEVINDDIFDEDVYIVKINGLVDKEINFEGQDEVILTMSSTGSTFCGGGCSGNVDLLYGLYSRPIDNCEVKDNLVVYKDIFNEGETFALNCEDLENCREPSQEVVKICSDAYPMISRDLDSGLNADLSGRQAKKLVYGESITVPSGEVAEFSYFTYYEQGITPPCKEGEVIVDGECQSFLREGKDEIIIDRYRELIPIGRSSVAFDNTLNIGDMAITSNNPTFSCSSDVIVNSPQPESSCWKSLVYYGKEIEARGCVSVGYDSCKSTYQNVQAYLLQDSEIQVLNDYLDIQVFISGRYRPDEGILKNLNNRFILNINFDFMSVEPIADEDYYIIKDSEDEFCFNIDNKLANFDESGYRLTKTWQLLKEEEKERVMKPIFKGENQVCLPLDTSRYGKVEYKILPFIVLKGDNYFDDEQLVYNFEVVDEIPTEVVYETITETVTETRVVEIQSFDFDLVPRWGWIALGVLLVLWLALSLKKK